MQAAPPPLAADDPSTASVFGLSTSPKSRTLPLPDVGEIVHRKAATQPQQGAKTGMSNDHD